ncbi:helix-turn-helix domain-containing protein [uncultured Sulfitobacter sp.]|uniref:arsenate reductase/protein-tyrosine-phosphatase family protein n=1 Tax=uncultured Sulfitobacter sp. TaxID=191468 RepID=UPI002637E141|nr:helix-turn-helix domain-containing protein [uncultured Sulfitobacter sp.]
MEKQIPSRLSTLGHPQRLAIFRLLMRRYPEKVAAGEMIAALAIKPSTLSAYLAALMRSGLVTQERTGTSLRYCIAMAEVRRTFDYLFLDCCRGRADLCSPGYPLTAPGVGPMPERKRNVLFICTGNSARSIFAEAILRQEAGDRFEVFSAGSDPRRGVNPFAREVLERKGHDVTALRPKSVTEMQGPDAPRFDFVFTVCSKAANQECPAWIGQPVSAHWGIPDPAAAQGTRTDKSRAFEAAYDAVADRVLAFAILPFPALDRVSLQDAVDAIGRLNSGDFV